jgi:hypothetical protein
VLKEFEIKEIPDCKQVTFSIAFVKKKGEIFFIPPAVASGILFNGKVNLIHGVPLNEAHNEATGYAAPVPLDGIMDNLAVGNISDIGHGPCQLSGNMV